MMFTMFTAVIWQFDERKVTFLLFELPFSHLKGKCFIGLSVSELRNEQEKRQKVAKQLDPFVLD